MTTKLYDISGKNVYLSGPVTGLELGGVIEQFEAADVKCKMHGAAYVYNPLRHVHHEASHDEAMLECLANLVSRDMNDELPFFDTLVMLDRWNESAGARVEHAVAGALGIDRVSVHMIGGAE